MRLSRIGGILCGAVLVPGWMAMAWAAGGYHLLKKYPIGQAEGSTREYFDYITVDSAARRVYLSHGTEVKVIDADNGSVVGTIGGLKQTHGVAIADEFGRGFITDGAQGKAVIFDLKTLQVTGEAKADKDADSVAYDPATGMLYVSTREGFVHIFREDTPDKYSEVEKVKTELGAKTMGLDTKTHNIFVDTADFAATAGSERPQPVPGTFHVLVYGK